MREDILQLINSDPKKYLTLSVPKENNYYYFDHIIGDMPDIMFERTFIYKGQFVKKDDNSDLKTYYEFKNVVMYDGSVFHDIGYKSFYRSELLLYRFDFVN